MPDGHDRQYDNQNDNRLVKLCELYMKSLSSSRTSSQTSRTLRLGKEHLLICYAVAGYQDIKTTKEIVSAMIESGADIIEIGFPFSDPITDGPVIQEASFFSLSHGMTPDKALEIVKDVRKQFLNTPIVAMTYSNILLKAGFRNFMRKAKQFGIDGFILPDLPIEESDEYLHEASRQNLAPIFLVSPNTDEKRLCSIASKSKGFLYLVSVYGTTGIRKSFEDSTARYIKVPKELWALHSLLQLDSELAIRHMPNS